MRTGLIPTTYATVEDAAVPLDIVDRIPRHLRQALRIEAEALDLVADAARAGDVRTVLNGAAALRQAHDHVLDLTFDTTAA